MVKQVLFSYLGHKQKKEIKLFDKYIKDINNYDLIVEPFCGHFGFSTYYCDNFKGNYVLNDNNKVIIDIFKDVQDGNINDYINIINTFKNTDTYKGKTYINTFKKLENNKRETFQYKDLLKDLDLNNKHDYVLYKKFCNYNRLFHKIKNDVNEETYKWMTDLLKKSTITCGDFKDCIDKYKDNEKALIYLDPPYFQSNNADYTTYIGDKKHDENKNVIDHTGIYIEILDILKDPSVKATIMFSINKNAITNYIYKDFILEDYNKTYQPCKRKENVFIISNKKL